MARDASAEPVIAPGPGILSSGCLFEGRDSLAHASEFDVITGLGTWYNTIPAAALCLRILRLHEMMMENDCWVWSRERFAVSVTFDLHCRRK